MSYRARQGQAKGQSSSRTKKSKSTGSASADLHQTTISRYFATRQQTLDQTKREEEKPPVFIQGHRSQTSSEGAKSERGNRKLALSIRKRKSEAAGLVKIEEKEKEDSMNLANKQLKVDGIEKQQDDPIALYSTPATIAKTAGTILEEAMKCKEMDSQVKENISVENKREQSEVEVNKVVDIHENNSDEVMEMEGMLNDDSLLKDLSMSDVDLWLSACDDAATTESDKHVGVVNKSCGNRSSVVICHVKECEQLTEYKIMLRVSFEEEKENQCIYLTENWANTDVRPGDVIQLVGDFPIPLPRNYIVGDGDYVIVNPDRLISVTTISRAIDCDCERRAVLEDLLKGASCETQPMLKGTLLHEVFDQALELFQNGKPVTSEALEGFVDKQLMYFYNKQKLYALGLTEEVMKESMVDMVGRLVEWCHNTLSHEGRDGIQPKRNQANSEATVTDVQDIEENVWCPRYGMKGKVDATLLVKEKDSDKGNRVRPLELKTGRMMSKFGTLDHRAQVILYCLMLSDRHQTAVPNGLLYYMKTGHTQTVSAPRNETIGLVQIRNRLARFHGNYWDHVNLPKILRNRRTCQRCPLVKKCTLYHRVIEGGDSSCSGLNEEEYMSGHRHLNTAQLAFFKKWFSLAMEEFTYSQVDNWKEPIWRRNHMLREREGSCISSLLSREPTGDGDRFIQEFVRVGGESLPDANMFGHKEGYRRVVVSKQDGTGWALASGSIHNITASSIFLRLTKPVLVDDGLLYCVDSAGDTNKTEMGLNNIMELCTSDSERDQRLRELIIDLDCPVFEPPSHTTPHPFTKQLNSDQQRAVEKVLCSKDYSLMLGMPGTGKTTTIAYLVQVLVGRGSSVLLTSYTNSAVDNVLLKLKKAGVDFLRVGSEERIHNKEILSHLTQRAAAGVNSVAQLKELYNSKKVVAATCHSTNLGHAIFSQRHFDYCVCDEATQLPLPLSLGVIRCASVFVLVGDHHQLPPLVLSPTAREGGYTESLFHLLSSHHPSAVVPLTQQYRMNSDIMLLANKLIYNDKLVCGSDEVKNGCLQLADRSTGLEPDWLEKSIDPARSVVFLNTDTCGDNDVEAQSHENDLEARLTQSLVEKLVKFGVKSADIMVITPYQKQVKLLNGCLPNVEVLTVDKCQGRDSECVIISFVKKNTTGQVGLLLQNWRRINVALTRARHKLILIGSPFTLSHTPILSSLIQLISEKDWMIDVPPHIL